MVTDEIGVSLIKRKHFRIAIMPLFDIILIETHNICTRRCWFCKFGQKRQDARQQFLPDELIAKIAQELGLLHFAGRISPFGINEPLLDPRLLDIIRLFRSHCPHAYLMQFMLYRVASTFSSLTMPIPIIECC